MVQETAAAQELVNTTVTSQIASAAMIGYALNFLRQAKWFPWLGEHSKGVKYALTGLLSFVTALGIHYSFDATAGVLTIGGLHAASIMHSGWEWITQWFLAQLASDHVQMKMTAEAVSAGNVEPPTGITRVKE